MSYHEDKKYCLAKSFIKKIKGQVVLALTIFLNCNSYAGTSSDNETADEYAVKATYIYNILRFVSWPDSSPLASTESLNICLFKDDPFGLYLDQISKKSITKKPIKLKTIMSPSESASCHLIFINDNRELDKFKGGFQLEHNDSILLGNDIEFIKNGGLLSFYIDNSKVRLGANRTAIANTRLNISSMLIEVCKLHDEER